MTTDQLKVQIPSSWVALSHAITRLGEATENTIDPKVCADLLRSAAMTLAQLVLEASNNEEHEPCTSSR